MKLVMAVMPWHIITAPNGAASVLAAAVRPRHEADIYYGSVAFAEDLMLDADTGPLGGLVADDYMFLAEQGFISGLGEWVFAQAMYGRDMYDEEIGAAAVRLGMETDKLRRMAALAVPFADRAAAEIVAMKPDLVGFTTTFSQTMPSLAVARAIKRLAPHVDIVFGGSNCDGPMGPALQRSFGDCVDFVVRREGEAALIALLDALAVDAPDDRAIALAVIPGLTWTSDGGTQVTNPEATMMPAGKDFPAMDQSAYFAAFEVSPLSEHIQPALMFESARGCWWGAKHHCTFCGLSDLILPFRSKPADGALAELVEGVRAHQVLDVLTTDNIIDTTYYTSLLPALAELGYDLRLMYEIKANVGPRQAKLFREAGVMQVQPGIENLHSGPLALMNKGTTGANNVGVLRDLHTEHLTVIWNYLLGFPEERAEDYEEVIRQMPLLWHLQPALGAHRIMLERFNPYFEGQVEGFAERTPLRWYRKVYPDVPDADLHEMAYLFDSPEQGIGEALTARLKSAIREWSTNYAASSLSHRLVDGELYIYDRRAGREPADYLLADPLEVAVYLAMDRGRTPEQVANRLQRQGTDAADEATVARLIDEFCAAGLVYRESGLAVYLSVEHDVTLVRNGALQTSKTMKMMESRT